MIIEFWLTNLSGRMPGKDQPKYIVMHSEEVREMMLSSWLSRLPLRYPSNFEFHSWGKLSGLEKVIVNTRW